MFTFLLKYGRISLIKYKKEMIYFFKKIKWFFQRGIRGYSDEDLWNFKSYLNLIMPVALRQLKNTAYGCPGELHDSEKLNDECHKWKEVLEEMAQGFEAAEALSDLKYMEFVENDEGLFTREVNKEKHEALSKKFKKGLELFKIYYFDLWD